MVKSVKVTFKGVMSRPRVDALLELHSPFLRDLFSIRSVATDVSFPLSEY